MNRSVDSRWMRPVLTGVLVLFLLFMLLGTPQPVSARPAAEGETIRYVSTTGSDDTACDALGTPCLTINHAIGQAVNGDTIKVAVGTYTAASGTEVVLINKSITLSGGWDEAFEAQIDRSTIDGEGVRRGIRILNSSVLVEYFKIQNGFVQGDGGGIIGSFSNITIRNSIITKNVASNGGGGVSNGGSGSTLTINDTMIIENSANRDGGGGISSCCSTVLNNTVVKGNQISGYYSRGSGIRAYTALIVNNSTVGENMGGAGIYLSNGSASINNSTITKNQSYGIESTLGNLTVQNSIIAGNGAVGDCYKNLIYSGVVVSQGNNIIGNPANCPITPVGGDQFNSDPQLGPFIEELGVYPLASTSPAIDMGNNSTCPLADQRGVTRPQGDACDIGAYEYSIPGEPASIHPVSGGWQYVLPNTVFKLPLKVRVLDQWSVPVGAGVEVIFTAPDEGASGSFDNGERIISVVTDDFGIATTPPFTSNNEFGVYAVSASTSGVGNVAEIFLENSGWFVLPDGSDDNDCKTPVTACGTINAAIGRAPSGDTIHIAVGTYTSASNEVILINDKDITLSGGWNEIFTTQDGFATIDGEGARRGITINNDVTVTLERLEIQNGYHSAIGGGIYNQKGQLTVNESIVKNNSSGWGGGIFSGDSNAGAITNNALTVNNSNIYDNKALGVGGGIYGRRLTLNNSTIHRNTAGSKSAGGAGGGIYVSGNSSINNSTISENRMAVNFSGSGITFGGGNLELNNSTVSGNKGGHGGIEILGATLSLNNSTVTNNTPRGIYNDGTLKLKNTILAGNGIKGDCHHISSSSSAIISEGHNLVGDATGCSFAKNVGDRVGASANPIYPGLAPLQDNGGATFTHALYSNSPALNSGNPDTCLPVDQRGVDRPTDTVCDIGAYEGSIPAITPVANSPYGIVTATAPTFRWSKLDNVTEYQIQIFKGTKRVYNKIISQSSCKFSGCVHTSAKTLAFGNNYKWRVQAKVNGVWKVFSPFMAFKISAAKPGMWVGKGIKFYVTNTTPKVDRFAVDVYVGGCGLYRITRTKPVEIKGNKFSFSGTYYASGTFATPTSVSGSVGFMNYSLPGCGNISGGPFSWVAKWKSTAQPKSAKGGVDIFPQNLLLPEGESPFRLFEVEPSE